MKKNKTAIFQNFDLQYSFLPYEFDLFQSRYRAVIRRLNIRTYSEFGFTSRDFRCNISGSLRTSIPKKTIRSLLPDIPPPDKCILRNPRLSPHLHEFGNSFARWISILLRFRFVTSPRWAERRTIPLITLPVTAYWSGNTYIPVTASMPVPLRPGTTQDMILDNVRIAVLSSVRFNAISGYLRLRSVDLFDTTRGEFSIVSSSRFLTRVTMNRTESG